MYDFIFCIIFLSKTLKNAKIEKKKKIVADCFDVTLVSFALKRKDTEYDTMYLRFYEKCVNSLLGSSHDCSSLEYLFIMF